MAIRIASNMPNVLIKSTPLAIHEVRGLIMARKALKGLPICIRKEPPPRTRTINPPITSPTRLEKRIEKKERPAPVSVKKRASHINFP
jgi:hypothetical protein